MFFRKRSIQVKMVKDVDVVNNSIDPNDISYILETVSRCTARVVFAYVGADTIRRLIVYATSSKI